MIGLTTLAVAALAALGYAAYQRDIGSAHNRLINRSQLAQTRCGPLEYASVGAGRPVLVVHGAGGGFDQALDFAEALGSGLQIIAVSRFGYLRTPMPSDGSAAAQADAHACLLDALGIKQIALIGASAGAPSSMQFALRYPERTTALVLLVPAAYVPRPNDAPPMITPPHTQLLFDTALQSDFLFWMATKVARNIVIRAILATPPAVVQSASDDEKRRVQRTLDSILPVSPRRLGLLNDALVTSSLPRYELEKIVAPTLVIGAEDDLFGTFDGARYTAAHISQARFVGYRDGGHIWVGHQSDVMAQIAEFLTGNRRGPINAN